MRDLPEEISHVKEPKGSREASHRQRFGAMRDMRQEVQREVQPKDSPANAQGDEVA